MNNHYHIPKKTITIPATDPVDISDFLPLIDHPNFQKLKHRNQLGINYLVFPGAMHTRFEHVMGTLGITQQLCRIHNFTTEEKHYLAAYALLHDIGHGPFSHQVEPVLGANHKEQGVLRLQEMEKVLQKCKLKLDILLEYMSGENPLGKFISDRNLGCDKLDYLRRDALHIGFEGMPAINHLQLFTIMLDDDSLAIEDKVMEDLKRIQKFYSYLHQHGYLNKTALSLQRILQRSVEQTLIATNFPPEQIWTMTDIDLLSWLKQYAPSKSQQLFSLLFGREFHRSILVIKPEGYGFTERIANKNIQVIEWNEQKLKTFSKLCNDNKKLTKLEDDLAISIGLAPGDLLFAAMPYFDKLIPKDIKIYANGSSFWLFEKDQEHYKSLISDYLRTFAIRLIVPPKHRYYAYQHISDITNKLQEILLLEG